MYQYFLSPIIGYLIGSIPFAWILVKLFAKESLEKDPTGIITTQKTIDQAGPAIGLVKGLLDFTKGTLTVVLIRYAFFSQHEQVLLLVALGAIGAVIGHSWQVWVGFRGGRAYSVFLGTLTIINPWGILIWIGMTIIFYFITKYTSLAGLIGTFFVATAFTLFYVFEVSLWHEWSILLVGWGYAFVLSLRLIPNFIALSKGELPKGR
jgi:glycerol-3-phosphate acyltransferase PlsY